MTAPQGPEQPGTNAPLELRPAAAPVSTRSAITAQARVEFRSTLRNWEQLLLLLVVPAAVLLLAGRAGITTAPVVLATTVALLATTFTSLAISTAFERRYGVLRALGTTPLSRLDLVVAKAVAAAMVAVVQILLLAIVAISIGSPLQPVAAVAILAGLIGFAPWALLLAMTMPAERVLALANAVFLLLAAASTVRADWGTPIPSVALRQVIEGGLEGSAGASSVWIGILVLSAWGFVGGLLVRRLARWSE
jgi:ABC-2 type transport system permease protein